MLVERWMTKNPQVLSPDDTLQTAKAKMEAGGFRRLPVVERGALVGILSDHDLGTHTGYLERTKVDVAMTQKLITVTPKTMIERAAHMLVENKIGGLPVVEGDKLVGIITTTDLLHAFSDTLEGGEEGVSRVDVLLDRNQDNIGEISSLLNLTVGAVLGVGTYRASAQGNRVFYFRVRSEEAEKVAELLRGEGYEVLGVHS